MKRFIIIGALAVMAVATAVPAEALNIHVGPRGVGVGVGHRGFIGHRRGIRRPFVRHRIIRGRRFHRF